MKQDEPTYPVPPSPCPQACRIEDPGRTQRNARSIAIGASRKGDLSPTLLTRISRRSAPRAGLITIEQAWNEFRSRSRWWSRPKRQSWPRALRRRSVLARASSRRAINSTAEADGRFVAVEIHDRDDSVARILVGVCNKRAREAGWAGRSTKSSSGRASTRWSSFARRASRAIPKRPWPSRSAS